MLVPRDPGFCFAALFLFVVFPAIGLIIRRKWRLAVARREEIQGLLVLASEEAARAELEASIGYSTIPPAPSHRHCAVCYCPTTTRCARCKSAHYCSGKCQIIHWRQGHKDECRPPLKSFEIDDEAINFTGNAGKQLHNDDYFTSFENDVIQHAKQGETAQEKPGFTNLEHSSSEFSVKDDNDTGDHSLDGKESLSQLHGFSVLSGIHASFSGDGMCVRDSMSDDCLHDLNSDSCDSCSTFDNDNLGTDWSDRNVELTEESYTRLESDGIISASCSPKEQESGKTTGSSSLSINCSDKNSAELSISSSGFWDGNLYSSKTRKHAYIDGAKPRYSFNSSGNLPSDLQGSEASSDIHPGFSQAENVEPSLVNKEPKGAGGHRSSTISSSKRPDTRVKEINSDGDLMKSREGRRACDNLKDSVLPSCTAVRISDLNKNTKDTLQSSISNAKFGNDYPSSGTKGHDAPAVKSVKADGSASMCSQIPSSTPRASVSLESSMLKAVEQVQASSLIKQNGADGRNYDKGVFQYELFVKLFHWNKVDLRPCGLINCGNSCYTNVVLQCLAFTPPLTAYLLQGLHSKSCVKKDWCFMCEFERVTLKAKEARSPQSPIGILSQLQKIGSQLSNGREEDAHEFIRYAIDTMQSICLQEAGVSASSSLEDETTLTGLTFGGYLRSKIKCTRCRGKSEKLERMMDLTVEIQGDIETLEGALKKFTGTENLDGENKYHCGRCKSYEKAKKKLSILEAPNVLTIALKRFQSGRFGKLNKSIQFPEILNLAPYMRGASDKSPIYRLYGVVVHLDTMNAAFSGHYVCYVRNAHNKWYKVDDSMISTSTCRCSPRAPRSIRSTIISCDFSNKIGNPETDPSQSNGQDTSSKQRDHNTDDLANRGYIHQDEIRLPKIPNIIEFDSSSDNSSLFSHSGEASSSTDSTQESIGVDDISDYIFGNSFWRQSSDSDTSSSSSSSSSSPLYTKHSPLSNSERYASRLSEPSVTQTDNTHLVHMGYPSRAVTPGFSFLDSNSSKQVRKVVNISSCRKADFETLGRANPLDNARFE